MTPIDEFPLKSWYSAMTVFQWWKVTEDAVCHLFNQINKNRNRPSDKVISDIYKLFGLEVKPSENLIADLAESMGEIKDRPKLLPEKIVFAFFKKLKKIAKNDNYNKLTHEEIENITKEMQKRNYSNATINAFRTMFLPESNPL